MRRFSGDDGLEWTVALSAGSYGSVTLMFATTADSAIYWLSLEAATAAEARELLDGFSDDELRRRLARAEPWQAT